MRTVAIIGGGAAGLILACALSEKNRILLFERGERLGRKLSATGNGQGNVSNLSVTKDGYFSVGEKPSFVQQIIENYDEKSVEKFFSKLGVLLFADERGRMYPASRQASSLSDALRYCVAKSGVEVRLSSKVIDVEKKDLFSLTVETPEGVERVTADCVALCVGGKAAKNFGSDGNGYALAKKFGHSVTALYPSLVQLKTDTTYTKTLKGIRVSDGVLRYQEGDVRIRGDIMFTEYGISGDAVFRLSAHIADKIEQGICLYADFLPDFTEEKLYSVLSNKEKAFSNLPKNELLFGIVNNQIGRAVMKASENNVKRAVALLKAFPLQVKGSLGFDYAQVTKGGIPLMEVDDNLQSKKVKGLYFAGEILDVDGKCGGYNLQWAYASARTISAAINNE